jgi:hypothetical protein
MTLLVGNSPRGALGHVFRELAWLEDRRSCRGVRAHAVLGPRIRIRNTMSVISLSHRLPRGFSSVTIAVASLIAVGCGSGEHADPIGTTVAAAPSISSQPRDTSAVAGQIAVFSVSSNGSTPFMYKMVAQRDHHFRCDVDQLLNRRNDDRRQRRDFLCRRVQFGGIDNEPRSPAHRCRASRGPGDHAATRAGCNDGWPDRGFRGTRNWHSADILSVASTVLRQP